MHRHELGQPPAVTLRLALATAAAAALVAASGCAKSTGACWNASTASGVALATSASSQPNRDSVQLPWMIDADGISTTGLVSRIDVPGSIVEFARDVPQVQIGDMPATEAPAVEARRGPDRHPSGLVNALDAAIFKEWEAQRLEELTIERFGSELFEAMRDDQRDAASPIEHERILRGLYKQLRIIPPSVPDRVRNMQAPPSHDAALDRAAALETQTVIQYDELLAASEVQQAPDAVNVFEHLRWVAKYRHWPAFAHAPRSNGANLN